MEKQVFVKVTQPKDVKELMDQLDNKILETRATLDNIKHLTEEEKHMISSWKANFDFINEKADDLKDLLAGGM
jgi:hypothetical protein